MSVRKAIYEYLADDDVLADIATGVFHLRVNRSEDDDEVDYPVVIFQKTSGQTQHYTFSKDDPPTDNQLWLVKGVGSSSQAEAIDERCQEILQDAPISIPGRTVFFLIRDSDMPPYRDDTAGETSVHIGSVYRLVSVSES
jgi:hypothetical protein